MKPAVCFLCGKAAMDEQPGYKGDWIEFSDYQAGSNTSLDHPEGVEYICNDHILSARKLVTLNSKNGLEELRKEYGEFKSIENNQDKILSTKTIWDRVVSLFRR